MALSFPRRSRPGSVRMRDTRAARVAAKAADDLSIPAPLEEGGAGRGAFAPDAAQERAGQDVPALHGLVLHGGDRGADVAGDRRLPPFASAAEIQLAAAAMALDADRAPAAVEDDVVLAKARQEPAMPQQRRDRSRRRRGLDPGRHGAGPFDVALAPAGMATSCRGRTGCSRVRRPPPCSAARTGRSVSFVARGFQRPERRPGVWRPASAHRRCS